MWKSSVPWLLLVALGFIFNFYMQMYFLSTTSESESEKSETQKLKSRLNLTYFMCKKDDLILTHFWCKGSMSSLQAARGISAPKPWKGITEMIPYSLYSGWHKHTKHKVIPTTVRFMQRAARSSFISITFFQMTTWTNRIKVTVLANKIIIIKQPKYILKSQTFRIVKLVYLLKKKRLIKSESIITKVQIQHL